MLQVGQTKPVAPEDAARLGMSTPENPMLITAVLRLGGPLRLDEFLALVDSRLFVHERLRAKIERSGLKQTPRWCRVETVPRPHVERVELGEGGDLPALVSPLMREPFDPRLPPWRAWLVAENGGGAALVFRIHHAIADGRSLL